MKEKSVKEPANAGKESEKSKQLVLVYGSLKKGYYNSYLLEGSLQIGVHVTEPEYTMYDLGAYPAITNTGGTAIHGELYEVDDGVFKRLDTLEGYPSFYNRKEVDTPYGKAWVYFIEDTSRFNEDRIVDSGVWEQ